MCSECEQEHYPHLQISTKRLFNSVGTKQLFYYKYINLEAHVKKKREELGLRYKKKSSSVYDCTVEDVEYIYNKLSIHIQQQNYSHRLNLL